MTCTKLGGAKECILPEPSARACHSARMTSPETSPIRHDLNDSVFHRGSAHEVSGTLRY